MKRHGKFDNTQSNHSFLVSAASYLALPFIHQKPGQSVLFNFSRLQLVAILARIQANYFTAEMIKNYPLLYNTTKLVNLISFHRTLEENYNNWYYSSVLVCTWIYLSAFFIVLTYLGVSGICGLQRHSILRWIKPLLTKLLQVHFSVLFWASMMVLVAPWLIDNQNTALLTELRIENNVLSMANIPFICITLLVGTIASLFCVNYLKNDSQYSTRTSMEEFSIFIVKAILTIMIVFPKEKTLSIVITMLVTTYSLFKHYYLLHIIPYYHFQAMKTCLAWSSIECWVLVTSAVWCLFQNSLDQYAPEILYIEILLAPLIVKISLAHFDKTVEEYSCVSNDELKSENEAFKKLLSLDRLLLKHDRKSLPPKSKLFFLGGLMDHCEICKDPNCYCYSISKIEDLTDEKRIIELKRNSNKFRQMLYYDTLKKSIQKIGNCPHLRILLIDEIVENKDKQPEEVLKSFYNLAQKDSNFFERIKRNVLIEKIQLKLENYRTNDYNLDMKRFLDFQNDKMICVDLMLSNIRKYINFWLYYNKPNFKLKKLLKKSTAFELEAEKLDRIFEYNMIKHSELSHSLIQDYSRYLDLVRNMPNRAIRFMKKYRLQKTHQKSITNFFSSLKGEKNNLQDSITLHVSLSKNETCKIVFTSIEGTSTLSYTARELFGKNLNILFSPIMGAKHAQIVNERYQFYEIWSEEMNHTNMCYVRDKEGFIMPCSVYVKIFPYIQKDLVYFCILKPVQTKYQYLVFTEEGVIEGASKIVSSTLNLPTDKVIKIHDICEDLYCIPMSTLTQDLKNSDLFFNEEEDSKLQGPIWGSLTLHTYTENIIRPKKWFIYEVNVECHIILQQKFYIMKLKNNPQPKIVEETVSDIPDEELLSEINDTPESPKDKQNDKKCLLISKRHDDPDATPRMENLTTQRCLFIHTSRENILFETIVEPMKTTLATEILNTQECKPLNKKIIRVTQIRKEKSDDNFKKKSSSDASSFTLKSKIEEGLHAVPSRRFIRSMKINTLFYLLLCGALLFTFVQKSQSCYDLMQQNTKILKVNTNRLVALTHLGRNLVYHYLLNNDIIQNTRYVNPYGITTFRPTILTIPEPKDRTLNADNTLLRQLLDGVDMNLQQQIYSYMVPLHENNQTIYKNIFDAALELTLKVKQVIANTTLLYMEDSPPINFILQNTFDEILVGSELVSDIILSDSARKLEQIIGFALFLLLGIVFLEVISISFLILQQVNLIKTRDNIINLFLTIKDEEITPVLDELINFETSLTNKHAQDLKYAAKSLYHPSSKKKKMQNIRHYRKDANFKGINLNHIFITCLGIFLALVLLMPFLHTLLVTKDNSTFIQNKMETITEMTTHIYESLLLQTAFLYSTDPKGWRKLRGNPLEEEWEAIYQKRSDMNTWLFNMLRSLEIEKTCDNSSIKSIHELFDGDLCTMFPDLSDQYKCSTIGGGAISMGLLHTVTYTFKILREMKEEYDNSNKTLADTERILDSIESANIENVLVIWHADAFRRINEILSECNSYRNQVIQKNLKISLFVYFLIYIVAILASIYCWKKLIEIENSGWKKLMRRIPIEIVIKSKALGNYARQERIKSL